MQLEGLVLDFGKGGQLHELQITVIFNTDAFAHYFHHWLIYLLVYKVKKKIKKCVTSYSWEAESSKCLKFWLEKMTEMISWLSKRNRRLSFDD